MKAIGVDIDGTLTSTISPYNSLTFDQKNFDIENILLQAKTRDGVNILNSCNMKIILITARHKEYQNVTEKWLKINNIKYDDIMMRSKRFTGRKFVESEYLQFKKDSCTISKINGMIEDDIKVVNMLNSCQIPSVLVNKLGRFDTAYFELLSKLSLY